MFPKLKKIVEAAKSEVRVWQLVMKDPRTPRISKILLWIGIGYLFMPFELIPDFIPVIGYLDDLAVIYFCVKLAVRFIPKGIIEDCRQRAKKSLP